MSARRAPATRTGDARRSADERREEVLGAALAEFAVHGLDGTSTEAIAKRIGISQPYIFRLFPSKRDLFLATIDLCFDRVERAFTVAAEHADSAEFSHPASRRASDWHGHAGPFPVNPRMHAMAHAYVRLLAHRELLLFQMQAYAACGDDEVRRKVKQRWDQLMRLIATLGGAAKDELALFVARGMLLNVQASIGLVPSKAIDQWAHEALGLT